MTPVTCQRPGTKRSEGISFSATTSDAPSPAADLAATLAALPGGVVDGGEIVILAIKPSMWRPFFESAPWLVAWCFMAMLLTAMQRPLPGWSLAATAQFLLLIGFARLGVAVLRWVPAWYVLTNRRVIAIRGVRAPRIESCLLVEIRNTYLIATLAEKSARLGTISFVTEKPDRAAQVWQSIPTPEQVHVEVRRAIENAIDQHGCSY
jgi:hypothetical protein